VTEPTCRHCDDVCICDDVEEERDYVDEDDLRLAWADEVHERAERERDR